MSLLKIPSALFPSLVRQIAHQKVKELNRLVLQPRKLVLGYAGLAGGDIPFHAANEDINDISTELATCGKPCKLESGLALSIAALMSLTWSEYTHIISMYIYTYQYTHVCHAEADHTAWR